MIADDILFALWFFLPAGLANATPVFANKIPRVRDFTVPLDFNKNFRGRRIFGEHKSFRGVLSGILVAILVVGLQKYLYMESSWIREIAHPIQYEQLSVAALGVLFGLGALGFDAIESFFKRQIGIKPGATWFPFDQTDYIIGGLLLSSIVVDLPHSAYWWIGLVWFLMHLMSSFIGWLLGLKDAPI